MLIEILQGSSNEAPCVRQAVIRKAYMLTCSNMNSVHKQMRYGGHQIQKPCGLTFFAAALLSPVPSSTISAPLMVISAFASQVPLMSVCVCVNEHEARAVLKC